MKRPGIAIVAVFAVLAVAAFGVWSTRSSGPEAPSADEVTPPSSPAASAGVDEPFELFDGGVARVADWRGTPMVVNFWASWCPPCVAEMRDALEPMHQELGDGVAFVGLNLQDTPDRANAIVEQTGVTYVLGLDPAGVLFTAFGGFGMPTTVFIDETGAVVDSHTGAFTLDQLRTLIQTNLGVAAMQPTPAESALVPSGRPTPRSVL
jgi:cytochrome c biogenesis protein CcmG, thiol:disulfide interchange protein DsbE